MIIAIKSSKEIFISFVFSWVYIAFKKTQYLLVKQHYQEYAQNIFIRHVFLYFAYKISNRHQRSVFCRSLVPIRYTEHKLLKSSFDNAGVLPKNPQCPGTILGPHFAHVKIVFFNKISMLKRQQKHNFLLNLHTSTLERRALKTPNNRLCIFKSNIYLFHII